jgi:hypothetical protein
VPPAPLEAKLLDFGLAKLRGPAAPITMSAIDNGREVEAVMLAA